MKILKIRERNILVNNTNFQKEKGSKNCYKQRIKIARLHEKISNIRTNFQHELSYGIINDNQVIISEDLNVKGIIKNPKLAKRIADTAWSEFCRQLDYKAKWYSRKYHKIDRWFASSQTCSECGSKKQGSEPVINTGMGVQKL